MSHITIRDVARAAGVSVSSASVALSGGLDVSEETRRRVQRIAGQLGYRRLAAAAALSSRAHRSPQTVDHQPVAYLNHLPAGKTDPFAEAACHRLKALGYEPIVHNLWETPDHAALSRRLWSCGVTGVVVGQVLAVVGASLLRRGFEWTRFHAVACNRFDPLWTGHVVRSSHFEAAKRLVLHCVQLGYRRIAVCAGRHDPRRVDDEARVGGARAAIEESGGVATLQIFPGTVDDTEAKIAWLRRTPCDVVIGFNDACGHRLVAEGYRVPDDIGFAALVLNSGRDPRWAGNLEPFSAIACKAVELLDQELRYRREPQPGNAFAVVIAPRFFNGASLPARVPTGAQCG